MQNKLNIGIAFFIGALIAFIILADDDLLSANEALCSVAKQIKEITVTSVTKQPIKLAGPIGYNDVLLGIGKHFYVARFNRSIKDCADKLLKDVK